MIVRYTTFNCHWDYDDLTVWFVNGHWDYHGLTESHRSNGHWECGDLMTWNCGDLMTWNRLWWSDRDNGNPTDTWWSDRQWWSDRDNGDLICDNLTEPVIFCQYNGNLADRPARDRGDLTETVMTLQRQWWSDRDSDDLTETVMIW